MLQSYSFCSNFIVFLCFIPDYGAFFVILQSKRGKGKRTFKNNSLYKLLIISTTSKVAKGGMNFKKNMKCQMPSFVLVSMISQVCL